MPRGDGTGPAGTGPMTGRGAGYCSGSQNPGFAVGAPRGGGFGRGRGSGRSAGSRAGGVPTPRRPSKREIPPTSEPPVSPQIDSTSLGASARGFQDELAALRQEARALEDQLKQISTRISELEQGGER